MFNLIDKDEIDFNPKMNDLNIIKKVVFKNAYTKFYKLLAENFSETYPMMLLEENKSILIYPNVKLELI